MLHLLFTELKQHYAGFNAFSYLSSRAILALLTAILFSMAVYPPFIKLLRALKLGQPIRELQPINHMEKKGTPTMGGVVIIVSTLFSALLWMDTFNRHLWTLAIITIGYGFIGFLDDYLKITKKTTDGLKSRHKMFGLTLVAALAVGWHMWAASKIPIQPSNMHHNYTSLNFPFLKDFIINLGVFYAPFALLVITGTSNAVNLTDGLDGLAIGPVLTCSIAMMVLCYVTGNAVVSKYLYYHLVSGSGEVIVFLAALIGSSIGFLWYNTWPAQVFMGDSGSLPLGGILGTVAIISGHEILLVIMGGVFVVEALSVIIQVTSFKTRGKRIFKMAPIHHHYEKLGWPEQKITIRAWIISFMLALFSILTLKLR
jgi:phospho-N-acetylmuramoyl-pentapeptide-transferase